jgi:hypothetical protein
VAVFGIILCRRLLAVFASRLVGLWAMSEDVKAETTEVNDAHLKTVLGTARSTEQLILSNLTRSFFDTR